MIRYSIAESELLHAIDQENPTWRVNAARRTAAFARNHRYKERKPSWSLVKGVYMRLQHYKCAFCERRLEGEEHGRGEHDVEHFRPKRKVHAWQASQAIASRSIPFSNPPTDNTGYFKLAYHPWNYAASCNACNRNLKQDYFPVAAAYSLQIDRPQDGQEELPYLIYPLGDIDDDPETLICFNGISPTPVASNGHQRNRALVTIEFFRLDDGARKALLGERARLLLALFPQLEKAQRRDQAGRRAQEVVDAYQKPSCPHANCMRSFVRLYQANREEARKLFEAAEDYVLKIS